jgi:hypothetical protein
VIKKRTLHATTTFKHEGTKPTKITKNNYCFFVCFVNFVSFA